MTMTMSEPTAESQADACLHNVNKIYSSVQDAISSKCQSIRDGIYCYRPVSESEIITLRGPKCRCTCTDDDWSKIYIRMGESDTGNNDNMSSLFDTHLSDNHFDGIVIFDLTTTSDGTAVSSTSTTTTASDNSWARLRPGVHSNSLIVDSIIHLNSCRVYRNSCVSQTFVGPKVILMNCGQVSTSGPDKNNEAGAFHGRIDISVGPESGGGRPLDLDINSTMIHVGEFLRFSETAKEIAKEHAMASHSQEKNNLFNILSSGVIVRDTPTIQDVFLKPSSSIVGACSVKNVMLQAGASISNSSTVSNVLMQWDATISDSSNVDTVMMMEHSHCGPNSIVHSSVIGPDCHVSAGEIHASVFGPNTNAHHQSLIIGVLWPLGRGNVGYGANVGSNHTGRSADQEAVAGEGLFWGLSSVIKFPVDLSFAPYSIVAAGTKLGQERICMPFSLINTDSSNEAENIILPGWVLQSTPYTLARNERKFQSRRKAKRHSHYTGWQIFRPSIIEMCRHAKQILEDCRKTGLSTAIPGIGNCRLTESARERGIEAYNSCIHRYILQGLLAWVLLVTNDDENGVIDVALKHEFFDEACESDSRTKRRPVDYSLPVQWPSFPWDEEEMNQNEWNYQRELILEEFPLVDQSRPVTWLKDLLNRLIDLEKVYAIRVAKCKRRDDVRGKAIIPGYSDSHVAADDDEVVLDVQKTVERNEDFISQLCSKLRDLV